MPPLSEPKKPPIFLLKVLLSECKINELYPYSVTRVHYKYKQLFHMKYLILLVFFISSCCPKITTTVATSSDTTSSSSSDTLTELTFDTTKVAPIFIHDTVNMSSFCDSLKHGLSPVLELRVSKGSIKIKSDSTGHSEIECLTDSLIQVTITQKETITNLNEQIIRSAINKQIVIEEPIYKNPFFWIVVGVILLLSFFAFRKR